MSDIPEFVQGIRTTDGDKKYDYNALGNLPNPTDNMCSVGTDLLAKINAYQQHAGQHAIGGGDWISPNSIGAANIPLMFVVNIPVDAWAEEPSEFTENGTIFKQSVPVQGVKKDKNAQWISVGPAPDAGEVYSTAAVRAHEQDEGCIIFAAEVKPTADTAACVMIQDIIIKEDEEPEPSQKGGNAL